MKPVTREWIEKAEKDLASARRELRLRKQPNFDLACFLAQQCIEKYLKGRLQEGSIRFDRTHDLVRLLDQTIAVEPLWSTFQSALRPLSAYATIFRYPGRTATKHEAQSAVNHAIALRNVIRQALGLNARPASQVKRSSRAKTREKTKRKTK